MLNRLLKKPPEAVPSFTKRRFFGTEQKAFYGRLRRALPKCYIFPDIPLSKLMIPSNPDPKIKSSHQQHLSGRRVDYAVFDARLHLLFVIELTVPPAPGANPDIIPIAALMASAGIRRFSWPKDNLPSTDQTLRALADYSAENMAKEGGPSSQMGEHEHTDAVPVVDTIIQPRAATTLTLEALAAMAPQGALKSLYPHVWERICLFCNEPRHLHQYLHSLSMQDRGVKRAGFSEEALNEIARIQVANVGYLQTQTAPERASWNDVFTDR
ncbi:hypothetical protein LXA47_32705 [Massilia sp. P8910]|uniref:DUF2726 domain-containing protein n=2 Tax=Massilia antarctica TaxID=2765360 RepID=A0AA48WFH2_9BURK|nr:MULTISPECIES: hypothetical protein [Massilia]CUI06396.1 hypothetical protein BN2497_7569 [Janthinobacterium sp. CG23_2]MCE3608330.1 hypothetical protein [Massilia antarctica]MCY0912132.1 hypothetical protein [Massilia sp. H27-R4]QPI51491.1 hypothetical protein IV454_08240 [Massilia antarctica]CUU30182.1 hypothetical protein BN3177_7569 [Janthinobacterium sp. CG23_2]